MQLVLATHNRGKLQELSELLLDLPVEILTLDDFPGLVLPAETGKTFRENALIKAHSVCDETGLAALADDSGLEVDFLAGAPGVHSARFAGESSNDDRNNAKLLHLLAGVPLEQRTARFRCVITLATIAGGQLWAEGSCEGRIVFEPRGEHGFGYDPLFEVIGLERTMAEVPPDVKHQYSHRGQALQRIKPFVAQLVSGGRNKE